MNCSFVSAFPSKARTLFLTKEAPVTSKSERTQWEGDGGWQLLAPGRDQLELPSPSPSTPFEAHTSTWKAERFPRKSWVSLSGCSCGQPTFTLHSQEYRAGVPSPEPLGVCPNCRNQCLWQCPQQQTGGAWSTSRRPRLELSPLRDKWGQGG